MSQFWSKTPFWGSVWWYELLFHLIKFFLSVVHHVVIPEKLVQVGPNQYHYYARTSLYLDGICTHRGILNNFNLYLSFIFINGLPKIRNSCRNQKLELWKKICFWFHPLQNQFLFYCDRLLQNRKVRDYLILQTLY